MAIDKKLRIFDAQGNEQDYDIMATDVKFLPDGKDLPTKLDEMQTGIDNAGQVNEIIMNGQTYTPTNKVIDIGTVITQHQDISDKVDKVTGKGLSTNDLTTALLNKLNGIAAGAQVNTINSIQTHEGQALTPDSNGIVTLPEQTEVEAVSVTTNQDGTFTIHVGDTEYTINLNHTHENMAKIVKCTSETLPETLANDTIYVQVDNATTPTEIESLWLFGLEFTGGGAAPGVPTLDYPRVSELTIEGDGTAEATSTIKVKAKNITGSVNVAISGSDFSITEVDGTALQTPITSANGPLVISNADALLGVNLTIAYDGSDDAQGSLVVSSAASTPEFNAKAVGLVADITIVLPAGWQADKAWNASGEVFSAPGDQEGYCTTEFFALTHDSSRHYGFIVKAGYVCDHDGITGDIPRGLIVLKDELSDTNTNSAYLQNTDPRSKQGTDAPSGNMYNYISVTLKMSELPNCYIYDPIAGRYLWAGSNVDQTAAPNV